MVVPADWRSGETGSWGPDPSAIIVITAATPMVIPSMVRAVRNLCELSDLIAMRRLTSNIELLPVRRLFVGQRFYRQHARGLAGRIIAEKDSYGGRHSQRDCDRQRRDSCRPL